PVAATRIWATIIAILAGLISLIGYRMKRNWTTDADEPRLIDAQYGRMLVPVASLPEATDNAVKVDSMAHLVRIASQYERAVLHYAAGSVHRYIVQDDINSYYYEAHDGIIPINPAPPGSPLSRVAEKKA
ncbi:MAG: DUF5305 family protein, partial [Firmicutes bacterium]|nr:DUF5305 family protein [Bacillota bacterium]